MLALPASEFCTPGRRAFGDLDLGLIDTDNDKYSGLQIAEFAITEWSEPVDVGSFVFVTTHAQGNKMTALFYILQVMHVPDAPDRAAVRGVWSSKAKDVAKWYPKRTFPTGIIQDIQALDPEAYILLPSYKGVGALHMVEPSAKILRGPDDFSDPDAEKLVASLIIHKYKWQLIEVRAALCQPCPLTWPWHHGAFRPRGAPVSTRVQALRMNAPLRLLTCCLLALPPSVCLTFSA